MKLHTIRLRDKQDLRIELLRFAKENGIHAGSILTCVGGVQPALIRMAGASPKKQDIRTISDKHEIVSLVGTFSGDDCHLHIALSNSEGIVIGGHLKDGSLVSLTAEIVIAEDESSIYAREHDDDTGFTELTVKTR